MFRQYQNCDRRKLSIKGNVCGPNSFGDVHTQMNLNHTNPFMNNFLWSHEFLVLVAKKHHNGRQQRRNTIFSHKRFVEYKKCRSHNFYQSRHFVR